MHGCNDLGLTAVMTDGKTGGVKKLNKIRIDHPLNGSIRYLEVNFSKKNPLKLNCVENFIRIGDTL